MTCTMGPSAHAISGRLRRGAGPCLAVLLTGCGGLLPPVDEDLVLSFNVEAGRPVPVEGGPVFEMTDLFDAVPGRTGSHAPTIAALNDGELLAAWYSYTGPHELDGSALYTARRPLGGRWSEPELHLDRPGGEGNPVLYAEGDRVWMFQAVVPHRWSSARVELQRSDDRGRTWTAPQVVSDRVGSNVRFPPVRTRDGTLLLPAYDELVRQSLFYESLDGENWRLRSWIRTDEPQANGQPSIARLSDGRLLAVMRNFGAGWLWVAASDDDGRSWSRPVDARLAHPNAPAALLGLGGDRLLLVFNDSPSERIRLTAALSADGGRSWPHRRVLAEGPGPVAYPAAARSPDGMIHVLWSQQRLTIRHAAFNEAWMVAEGPAEGEWKPRPAARPR